MRINTKIRSNRIFYYIECISFYLFNFYYVYRYILKYNSTGTSPTYSNTPVPFKAGKYIIAAIIIVALVIFILKFHKRIAIGTAEAALVIFAIILLVKSLYQRYFLNLYKMFMFVIPAYGVTYMDTGFDRDISKWYKNVLIYHIIYSAIQVFLYFAYNRLPALAYYGGLVRFGGGLDDPNGFSIFLIVPLCYLICNLIENGLKGKWLLLVILVIALELLTFSLSGYVATAIAALAIMIRYRRSIRLLAAEILVVSLLIFAVFHYREVILQTIEYKRGSAIAHMDFMAIRYSSLNEFIFGSAKYIFSESYYSIVAINYGFGALVALLFFELSIIYYAYKNYMKDKGITALTILVYLIGVSASQLGIAYFVVLPVNYLYFLAVFMTLRIYRSHGREKYADARRMPTVA